MVLSRPESHRMLAFAALPAVLHVESVAEVHERLLLVLMAVVS